MTLMRRSHMRFCGIALIAALGYLVLTGGSAGGYGLLIAVLVCPLAMILAMTVLMGHDNSRQPDPGRIDEPVDPVQHR